MKKRFIVVLLAIFVFSFVRVDAASAENLSVKLAGRILIQTENHGEAWYVNPENNNRYYLARPNDAFSVMSRLGLGISNKDFQALNKDRLEKLAGRILLKVEDSGKAYYINPLSLEINYLGRPNDAFSIMKKLGLGISNDDLNKIQESALNLSGFDFSLNPGDDFYDYVNANWVKSNEIPSDKSNINTFSMLSDKNYLILKKILESDNKERKIGGSIAQKVLDFYDTGMDTKKIEQAGLGLLADELALVDKIENLDDLAMEMGHIHMVTANPIFELYAGANPENSEVNIASIWQSGLGLPDRDYYLEDKAQFIETRAEYLKYLNNMFALLGGSAETAAKNAQTVIDAETALAKISMSLEDQRIPELTNNLMSLSELESLCPNFNWQSYFKERGLINPGTINVSQKDYLKGVSQLLKSISLADWKIYLKWNVLNGNADYLSKKFVDESFNFYDKFLYGKKEQQSRWKTVVDATNNYLGKPLGELYVKENFSAEAKEKMLELVGNLKISFKERIIGLDWMSGATKQAALKKLEAFGVKIGYPDVWPDYTKLEIKNDSYLANILKVRAFDSNKTINDIGKPVDKNYWWMNPQTVNAYYSPDSNEIVFPAGILQAPFFDVNADDAMNYGGIGMVIGHEMTHGFDDQGRKYDGKGNLKDWWTVTDAANFETKTKVLVGQFNKYSPLPEYNINGELTLGENIADLGGVIISYNAFKKTLNENNNKKIDGFTPGQRFFMSFAQAWKIKSQDEYTKYLIENDPHSPNKYRVNGPLSNFDEFAEAFNLSAGASMMRPQSDRIKIW
jgi:putative endopeptidase